MDNKKQASMLAAIGAAAAGLTIKALTMYQRRLEGARIGEALIALREACGLTAEEMWEVAKITPGRYASFEASIEAPTPPELARIFAAISGAYNAKWHAHETESIQ